MKKTAIIALVAISVAGTSHAWGPVEQAGLAGLFFGVVIGNQARPNSEQQPNIVYQQPNIVYQQPNIVYQQSITFYRAAHAPHIDRLPRGWCGVLGQDQYGNRVSVRCN